MLATTQARVPIRLRKESANSLSDVTRQESADSLSDQSITLDEYSDDEKDSLLDDFQIIKTIGKY